MVGFFNKDDEGVKSNEQASGFERRGSAYSMRTG